MTLENGRDVVNTIKHYPNCFDLIIMDDDMPVIDGIIATEIIRNELKWYEPIIGFLGNAKREVIKSCVEAGMNNWVSKPLNEGIIKNSISNYLSINNIVWTIDADSNEFCDFNIIKDFINSIDKDRIDYYTYSLLKMINGSEDSLKKILQEFVKEGPNNIARMKKAAADDKYMDLLGYTVSLKTQFTILLVRDKAEECALLSQLLDKNVHDKRIKDLVLSLTSALFRLTTQLEEDFNLS